MKARSNLAPLVLALSAMVLTAGTGCSAIVQPDPARLRGGSDGGGAGTDGGGRRPDGDVLPDGRDPCPGGCDDGVACTTDVCGADGCVHRPDDAACGAGQRCNAVSGCVPLRCTTDAECDDGRVCNGVERCDPASASDPSGCMAGAPMACDDGFACTNDLCVDAVGGCVFMPDDGACDDRIDCTADACDPGASSDASGCAHRPDDAACDTGFCRVGGRCDPGAGCVGGMPRNCDDADPCDVETCDEAAGACVSTPVDADGDGYPAARVPGPSIGGTVCPGGTDCDDARADVHPGAREICGNVRDEDCDGMPDDGCTPTLNDTCATASPIVLDAAGMGSASGSFSSYRDDLTTICGRSGGRDAVYYFDLTSSSDVVIDTSGSGGQDTVLAVSFDCSAPIAVCNDDQDVDAIVSSRIFLHRVGPAPGARSLRVYVFVDGYDSGATGSFRVNVRVTPPRPDACTSEPLDITGGGAVLGVGPTAGASGGPRGSCQGFAELAEAEGIFRLRGPSDGNVALLEAFSRTFAPDLYVRAVDCSSGTDLDCDEGMGVGGGLWRARIDGLDVMGGTVHFVFVDGMSGTASDGGPHRYVLVYDP